MHRSSETIGAIAAALAKAQGELTNPEKALTATIRSPFPAGGRPDLPLRLARQRPRYRPQGPRPARDRDRPDHRHRPGNRPDPADDAPGPRLRRMDLVGLAGLPDQRNREPAPDPVHHHRGRQMGRDHRPCRPALPAPATDRREEVLALRDERGGAPPIRGGTAATPAGSGP